MLKNQKPTLLRKWGQNSHSIYFLTFNIVIVPKDHTLENADEIIVESSLGRRPNIPSDI